jgi:hypothetical protein
MKPMTLVAAILLIIGGLNWGLVGAANFDLVATIFGDGSVLAKAVYVVVGLAAVLMAIGLFSNRRANA